MYGVRNCVRAANAAARAVEPEGRGHGEALATVDRPGGDREVLHKYCRALDLMDLEAIAVLFTEDCVVEYGPEERLRSKGAAGVAASLQRLWRWRRTSHHLSNIQIRFEGADRAFAG